VSNSADRQNKNVNTILDVRFCLGCEIAGAANPHWYFAALVARNKRGLETTPHQH
jgi:hypothetical protein